LLREQLTDVFVSYDIGCQWRINLLGKRLGDVPEELVYAEDDRPDINVALPVFHSACHEESCGSAETCRHKLGVGMTDGEGVERVWAAFNELASATKEMHQDVRRDALEDAIDWHNWLKNLTLGIHSRRKREVALVELKRQEENFALTGETISIEDKQEWVDMMDRWHEQEHLPLKSRTAKNPYSLAEQRAENITEARVAASLLSAEKDDLADGDDSLTGTANFVRMGLQLQKIQLRIHELKASHVAERGETRVKIQDLRIRFLRKLRDYRVLQATYMKPMMSVIMQEERARQAAVDAEQIKIYLPSDLSEKQRHGMEAAIKAELAFRRAYVTNALHGVRRLVHTKSHFIRFRHKNWRGQRKYTSSQRTLKDLDESIINLRQRYEISRLAIVALDQSAENEFREMRREDVSTRWVTDYDGAAARRLAVIGQSGQHRTPATQPVATPAAPPRPLPAPPPSGMPAASPEEQALYNSWANDDEMEGAEKRGGSRREMSWIWTAMAVPTTDQDNFMRESIRIEWCKAYARRARWTEEVVLLEEEERRIVQSLCWYEAGWRARAHAWHGLTAVNRGKRAYARRQADIYRRIHDNFTLRFTSEDELGTTGKKRKAPATDTVDGCDATPLSTT
ncbi:hypothetical protein CYLTODRAFT_482382, partial [Cylindrobasidium torrendii FP15055 ss-10]